jgi:glycosyltransferase involved in cell wall biosynthesis
MVSVVIPNYNNAEYLIDCVNSCLAENVDEIIVVDDASTDCSDQIIGRFIKDAPTFKALGVHENMGVSHARNLGIKASNGDFVITLDSDDMIVPGSVAERMALFNKLPYLDVVYGPMLKVQGDMPYHGAVASMSKLEIHPSEFTVPMYRRSVFARFGLFYEPLRSKEDKEMTCRLGVHRKSPIKKPLVNFARIDKPVYFYRRHENAKRKRRARDLMFDITTCMEFDKRMKQLEVHGITAENTEMLK